MKIGCWPLDWDGKELGNPDFMLSTGCFEAVKCDHKQLRLLAYNLHEFNHIKTEAGLKELLHICNESFNTKITFHKIDKGSENTYINYLTSRHGLDISGYIYRGTPLKLNSNVFCYFSIPHSNPVENYYNFVILRMMFSEDFKILFEAFFKLLGTINIPPFELFQLCHFAKRDAFGCEKNLLYHTIKVVKMITPVEVFYKRLPKVKMLYECFDAKELPMSKYTDLYEKGEYMTIYDELK